MASKVNFWVIRSFALFKTGYFLEGFVELVFCNLSRLPEIVYIDKFLYFGVSFLETLILMQIADCPMFFIWFQAEFRYIF